MIIDWNLIYDKGLSKILLNKILQSIMKMFSVLIKDKGLKYEDGHLTNYGIFKRCKRLKL